MGVLRFPPVFLRKHSFFGSLGTFIKRNKNAAGEHIEDHGTFEMICLYCSKCINDYLFLKNCIEGSFE